MLRISTSAENFHLEGGILLAPRDFQVRLTKEKSRIYNFIARQVIDKIPFEKNRANRVELIIDKSKSKPEIEEFNSYIRSQIQGRLDPKIILDMYHWSSQENAGLQVADMFCWRIFQKYAPILAPQG